MGVPRTHGDFTECRPVTQKVDRSRRKITLPYGMLTEGPTDEHKVDRMSRGCTEC